MASPSRGNSARVNRLWKRLQDWYGSRFGDVYGPEPPDDWRAAVESANDTEIAAVLVLIRQRHVTFPPTLPEFEALFREARRQHHAPVNQPTMAERLSDFAVKNRTLTFAQLRGWTFRYRVTDEGQMVTTALEIPADGYHPGHRITVDDMLAETETPR